MQLLHVLSQITILGVISPYVRCKVGETMKNSQELTRVPKQIQMNPVYGNAQNEPKPAETGSFGVGSAGLGHGKYFQDSYTMQYGPNQYEYGHICENPDEWEQRYEKKDHDKKHFMGQARWGDKHGGYGEHYWDYNHAGHHDGGGGGGGGGGGDGGGGGSDADGGSNDEESDEEESDGYSHNIPEYSQTGRSMSMSTSSPIFTSSYPTTSYPSASYPPSSYPPASYPSTSYPSTSYSPTPSPYPYVDDERVKRQHDLKASSTVIQSPVSLVYDIETGTVINEATGKSYVLHPVN